MDSNTRGNTRGNTRKNSNRNNKRNKTLRLGPGSLNPNAKPFIPGSFSMNTLKNTVTNIAKNAPKNTLKNMFKNNSFLNLSFDAINKYIEQIETMDNIYEVVEYIASILKIKLTPKEIQMLGNTIKQKGLPNAELHDCFAVDCEMVGVGPRKESALAEVSIVAFNGRELYHEYVIPNKPVTDYRTFVSGITSNILKEKGKPENDIKKTLRTFLNNKALIGHGLINDITVMGLSVPESLQWDTTKIPLFMRQTPYGALQPKKLKQLVKNFVGKNIQTGEHSATEDAEGSMFLFKWYVLYLTIQEITLYNIQRQMKSRSR